MEEEEEERGEGGGGESRGRRKRRRRVRDVIVSILFSTIKSILAAAHNIVCYDAHGVLVHIYSKYHLSLIGNT